LSKPIQFFGLPKPFQLKPLYQAASTTGIMTNSVNSNSAGGRNNSAAVSFPESNGRWAVSALMDIPIAL